MAYDRYHAYRQPLRYGPPADEEQQPPAPVEPAAPKRRRWPVVLTVSGAGVLSLCLFSAAIANVTKDPAAGVTTQPPAPAAVPRPAVVRAAPPKVTARKFDLAPGEVMTITGHNGSVQDAVIFSFKSYARGCGTYSTDPRRGRYLVADVLVKQQKGLGAVNPLFFTFVAEDGTTADALSGAFSNCGRSALGATNALRQGAKRAGQVIFDVESPAGSVEYAPDGLGAEATGSWKSK